VPELEEDGHDVTYVEFDDGHTIPEDIKRGAVSWLTG